MLRTEFERVVKLTVAEIRRIDPKNRVKIHVAAIKYFRRRKNKRS